MAKVVCESCGSSFPLERVKDIDRCPVCNASFDDEEDNGYFAHDEIKEISLECPDMYFYSIDSENRYENQDLRDVWCQCTSCREVNTISYNKFSLLKPEYVKLKESVEICCKGCGKAVTNLTIPKRPDGWRRLNMWEKEDNHTPKCPTCSSTNIKKITVISKATSVAMWGVLSRKVHKQWHCNTCGSEW